MSSYQIKDKRLAERFQFIEHAGKEILVLDYSHADRQTCFDITAEFESLVQTLQPVPSLRILFDMNSPYYDPAHANHWRASAARYEKYFLATAMINSGPIFKLILSSIRIYLKLIGKPMNEKRGRLFESKAAALDFLSRD